MSGNKQPVIGITMCLDMNDFIIKGAEFNYVRREYGEQVRSAGGQPIFLDNTIHPSIAAELCDGIIISGGHDIDPVLYGKSQVGNGLIEPFERTVWERKLIEECDKRGIRILGVCYGSQVLNLHYGGSLYQDLKIEKGVETFHGTDDEISTLRIRFNEDFLSFQEGDNLETAHRHHQAVKDLAPGFTAVAQTGDGVIEAIAGRGHFGIQWHAECDGTAPDIYGAYVAICAGGEVAQEGQLQPIGEAA